MKQPAVQLNYLYDDSNPDPESQSFGGLIPTSICASYRLVYAFLTHQSLAAFMRSSWSLTLMPVSDIFGKAGRIAAMLTVTRIA